MKYRKPQKLNSNLLSKPYCKHILFSKNSNSNIHTDGNTNNQKSNINQTFISPVHKNNYIYKTNENDNCTSSVGQFKVKFPSSSKENQDETIEINQSITISDKETTKDFNNTTFKTEDKFLPSQQSIHEYKTENESENSFMNVSINNSNIINHCKNEKSLLMGELLKRHRKTKSELSETFNNDIQINSYRGKPTCQNHQQELTLSSFMKDQSLRNLLCNNDNKKTTEKTVSYTSSNITKHDNTKDNNSNKQLSSPLLEPSQSLKHFHTFSGDIYNNQPFKRYNTTNQIVDFQEILEIQIKLNHILLKIENYSTPNIEIFSWWNYYFKSKLISTYMNLFNDVNNKKSIDMFFKIEALISILCFDVSQNKTKFDKARIIMKSIYSLIHFNFLIFIKFLLVKYNNSNDEFADKLNSIIKTELSNNIYNKDMKEFFVIELLRHNNKNLSGFYKKLLEMFYVIKGVISCGNNGNCEESGNQKMSLKGNKKNGKNINNNSNDNKEIISSFFLNAFNSINSYTYSDYNTFIRNYLNTKNGLDLMPIKVHERDDFCDINNNISQTQINGVSRNIKTECTSSNSVDANTKINSICKHRHIMSSDSASSIYSNKNPPYMPNINYVTSTKSILSQRNPILQSYSLYSTNPNHQLQEKVVSMKSQNLNQTQIYFLPQISTEYEYSLILDLDETLVHVIMDKSKRQNTPNQAKIIYRPLLFEFLRKMKQLYEIIIFTVSQEDYANKVIDCIEKKEKYFAHKLYRQHVTFKGGEYFKDLSKLGRDLRKMVIVDNIPQNFALQKENGICIKSFYGECNEDNNILNELGNILERVRFDTTDDIRKSLLKYKERIRETITDNRIEKL